MGWWGSLKCLQLWGEGPLHGMMDKRMVAWHRGQGLSGSVRQPIQLWDVVWGCDFSPLQHPRVTGQKLKEYEGTGDFGLMA